MQTFEMKTVIHFGSNSLDRLKTIPYQRILIITDPFVAQSEMIRLITEPLKSAGKEYDIFSDVVPDAPLDKIAAGSFWNICRRPWWPSAVVRPWIPPRRSVSLL